MMDLNSLQQQSQGMPQQPPQGMLPQQSQGGQHGILDQEAVKMMTALAQNPTPQLAQQIAQAIQQEGDPEDAQFVQALMQAANNPQALKQLAMQILQGE